MLTPSTIFKQLNENIICQEAFKLIYESSEDANFMLVDFRPDHMYLDAHFKGRYITIYLPPI